MADFIAFVRAVASHWATLMTGGFVMAVLGTVERYLGAEIPNGLFWAIALAFFFAAFFLAWRDKDRSLRTMRLILEGLREELAEEKRRREPNLVGNIHTKLVGESGDGLVTVHMVASIRNLGAPSFVEGYGLVIHVGTDTFIGQLELIRDGTELYRGEATPMVDLLAADALYEKTRLPIPQGGQETGWLKYTFPGLAASRKDILLSVGAKWVLTFLDVTGSQRQAVEAITPSGFDQLPLYYPGAGGTIHPHRRETED